MRDIRGDLQERAMLIEKEIAAAGDDFDRTVESCNASSRHGSPRSAWLCWPNTTEPPYR